MTELNIFPLNSHLRFCAGRNTTNLFKFPRIIVLFLSFLKATQSGTTLEILYIKQGNDSCQQQQQKNLKNHFSITKFAIELT